MQEFLHQQYVIETTRIANPLFWGVACTSLVEDIPTTSSPSGRSSNCSRGGQKNAKLLRDPIPAPRLPADQPQFQTWHFWFKTWLSPKQSPQKLVASASQRLALRLWGSNGGRFSASTSRVRKSGPAAFASSRATSGGSTWQIRRVGRVGQG